jgi:hypothetical protein
MGGCNKSCCKEDKLCNDLERKVNELCSVVEDYKKISKNSVEIKTLLYNLCLDGEKLQDSTYTYDVIKLYIDDIECILNKLDSKYPNGIMKVLLCNYIDKDDDCKRNIKIIEIDITCISDELINILGDISSENNIDENIEIINDVCDLVGGKINFLKKHFEYLKKINCFSEISKFNCH